MHFGAMLAVPALMQFLFAPILGALSDRFGRRPVLLVSLAGASRAAFGACHALVQALTGPVVARLGERAALLAGVAADGLACC